MKNFDERYLCAYLCNKKYINKFDIVMNFYKAISSISLKTKDRTFMQIRLQWYIDAIKALYNNETAGVPIIDNLLPILKQYNIQIADFEFMLEARSKDKDYIPFNNIEEYITYCKNTGGILWKLIMQIYGGNKTDQEAAYYSGVSFAILGNIRNINFDMKRMHYKLVFHKDLILKGNQFITEEVLNNIKILKTYVIKYIFLSKAIKVTKKLRRLLLLNTFSIGYYKVISKYNQKLKLLNPYELPICSKLEFIFKYLFNKY